MHKLKYLCAAICIARWWLISNKLITNSQKYNVNRWDMITGSYITVKLLLQHKAIIYKCKEKFVILQSIGIVAIKSSETRAVIYTCRYSSRQFNP